MRLRPGPSDLPRLCPLLRSGAAAALLACGLRGEGQSATADPLPDTPSTTLQEPLSASQSGTVRGSVLDTNGAMIQGATVDLFRGASHAAEVTTDLNGEFTFTRLPAGAFTLKVTLPGFTSANASGTVLPGQTVAVATIALALAAVAITVDAITPEQAALEQIHVEEQQRLLGVLPNFFVSYAWTAPPLTPRMKFTLAWKNVIDPGNIALSATVAGVQQADDAFPGYHQGWKGYGRRFGADYANLWAGTFMGGAVLPTLFHQDPRYFYKGTGTIRSRALYAISRAVICRGDNGKWQPNLSGVLGDLSAGAISNLYYAPSDRQGATLTIENGLLGVAGDAMNGLVQEFLLPRFTTRGKKKPKQ